MAVSIDQIFCVFCYFNWLRARRVLCGPAKYAVSAASKFDKTRPSANRVCVHVYLHGSYHNVFERRSEYMWMGIDRVCRQRRGNRWWFTGHAGVVVLYCMSSLRTTLQPSNLPASTFLCTENSAQNIPYKIGRRRSWHSVVAGTTAFASMGRRRSGHSPLGLGTQPYWQKMEPPPWRCIMIRCNFKN